MPNKIREKFLHQHWVHSHEEDSATVKIFRPVNYNFPRSRGRTSFELKSDGTLIDRRIGPTDQIEMSQGIWKIQENKLVFYRPSKAEPYRIHQIISVDRDRMILAK